MVAVASRKSQVATITIRNPTSQQVNKVLSRHQSMELPGRFQLFCNPLITPPHPMLTISPPAHYNTLPICSPNSILNPLCPSDQPPISHPTPKIGKPENTLHQIPSLHPTYLHDASSRRIRGSSDEAHQSRSGLPCGLDDSDSASNRHGGIDTLLPSLL